MSRFARDLSISALVLTIFLPVALLTTISHSQLTRLTTPSVDVRPYGDAGRAIDRIRAKLITAEDLDRLANDTSLKPMERLALANAPLLVENPGLFSGYGYTPIGLYYTTSTSQVGQAVATTLSYYVYFTGERGGTPLPIRMARFGRPFDGELLYYVTFLDDRVLSAVYQAPVHRLVPFKHIAGQHPVFMVASENNNFELARNPGGRIITLKPENEFAANPYADPDFLALAAGQALRYDGIDIAHYVYLKFYCAACRGPIDVSIRAKDYWYHLHDTIADGLLGESVTVPGYYQTAIALPFAPQPGDIGEVRIVTRGADPRDLSVLALYVYPEPQLVN